MATQTQIDNSQRVINFLATQQHPRNVMDIARHTGINRNTLTHLLVHRDFVNLWDYVGSGYVTGPRRQAIAFSGSVATRPSVEPALHPPLSIGQATGTAVDRKEKTDWSQRPKYYAKEPTEEFKGLLVKLTSASSYDYLAHHATPEVLKNLRSLIGALIHVVENQ